MILPIDKALQLYKLLAPYIPDDIDDELELSSQILNNIRNSEHKEVYAEVVILFSGKTLDELIAYNADEILQMFIEGIKENRLVDLKKFVEQVGYNV
jgi:hypothetical protein